MARFEDHLEVAHETELQREINQREQFMFTAIEGFKPRRGDFAERDEYLKGDSKKLFVLKAHGGMGKSRQTEENVT